MSAIIKKKTTNEALIYNNCTSGLSFLYSEILLAVDCEGQGECCRFFFWGGGHRWKIQTVRGVSVTRLVFSLKYREELHEKSYMSSFFHEATHG